MLDLLVIILAVPLIWLWLQSRPFYWRGKGIDWKLPLPLIGNTSGSLVTPWQQFWKEFYFKAGDRPILGFHYFDKPALLIKDPDLVKKVAVTDADYFMAREFHTNPRVDLFGRSVFFTKNQEWKELRAKLTPYFTPARIKAMHHILESITDKYIQFLCDQSKRGPVDVHAASLKLSSNVKISAVFGLQPEAFDNPKSFFCQLQKEVLSFWTGVRVLVAIMTPKIYDWLDLTLLSKSKNEKLSEFVIDMLDRRIRGEGVRRDLFQGMVELMQDDMKSTSPNKSTRFDRDAVVGQCMLMYTAGTETSSNILAFLIYELSLNPEIQCKARQEVQGMLARTRGQYGPEQLSSLRYINMILSETLRKYPVAVGLGRMCTKTYRLTDQLEVQPGTIIVAPGIGIQSDPKNFPNPDRFDPERFSKDASIQSGTYLPFGLGPRTCLGKKLAEIEITLAVVKLLSRFCISPCEKTEIPIKFSNSLNISPKGGLWLTLQEL